MRRRLILASLLVASGALAASCVEYTMADDPTTDASVAVDAAPDADAPDVVLAADATDAATDAADAADAGDPCDRDLDGYRSIACDGGDDCDDDDPRAHPGSGFILDTPTSKTNGDWDCDGTVTKQYVSSFTCAVSLVGDKCATILGFIGTPACGEMSDFDTCTGSGLSCTVLATKKATQGCR